jgi:hypothetical protein
MTGKWETTSKIGKFLAITLPFAMGLLAGTIFSAVAKEERSIDDYVFGRAEALLASLHNVVISLSVDTERAAINIAAVNKRVSKLEKRLKKLEDAPAAKN